MLWKVRHWFRWTVISTLWRIGDAFRGAGTTLMDSGWMR